MPCLRVIDLEKSYDGEAVLQKLNLTVNLGESLVILGGSGSGKSVLLSLMSGLERADSGRVLLWGEDVTEWNDDAWLPLRKRIGMLFQGGALFDSLSVLENIAFPLRAHRDLTEAEIADQVAEKLEWVGLPGIEERLPRQLSGGMMKRVALARALVLEPDLVFYDEPTTGLDPVTAGRVSELIAALHERLGCTNVIVTHDMQCAFRVADRMAYLESGKIIEEGTPSQIRATKVPYLREYFEGGPSHEVP